MDINFELYKIFYYVAKNLSFSLAAKELFISQSAVSQAIRTLENRLGEKLFTRTTKKVILTPRGHLLYEYIEPAVHLLINGQLSLSETPDLSKGKLHIGASDTICRYFLIDYIKKFNGIYPKVHLQITNRTSTACVDLLRQGSVDLIITNLPNDSIETGMDTLIVTQFNDVFIADKEFKYLENKILSYSDLNKLPILMLEKTTTTSKYLYNQLEKMGIYIKPKVELGSIDLLIDMAKIGLGISFVPDYCLSSNEDSLFKLKLKPPLPKRHLGIVTNKNIPLSLAGKKFIELLTESDTIK